MCDGKRDHTRKRKRDNERANERERGEEGRVGKLDN